jgi:hypothetical protein
MRERKDAQNNRQKTPAIILKMIAMNLWERQTAFRKNLFIK